MLLSRFQFASTALYHFIFVPLTIGLSFLLTVMESLFVVTGKTLYKDMTKFWGKLLGINSAVGVATNFSLGVGNVSVIAKVACPKAKS